MIGRVKRKGPLGFSTSEEFGHKKVFRTKPSTKIQHKLKEKCSILAL